MKGLAFVSVFLFELGDALTTWFCLGLGFVELNPFFVPFAASLVFSVALVAVEVLPVCFRLDGKELIRAGLCLVALSPVLNNLAVLLGVKVF